MKKVNHFLDYMVTNLGAVICFCASAMVWNCHSDASYLTASRAQSKAGGHSPLGSIPKDACPISPNDAILTNWTTLKCVAALAAKIELGALFLNALDITICYSPSRNLAIYNPPLLIMLIIRLLLELWIQQSSLNVHGWWKWGISGCCATRINGFSM